MAEHLINNDPDPHDAPERNEHVSYDRGTEDISAITRFGIGLAIGVVAVAFAMWALFDWFYAREDKANPTMPPAVLSEKQQVPPDPRLQATPRLDIAALRESEDQVLNHYAWLDPNHGVARIPIEEAIKIIAAKGLPTKVEPGLANSEGYRVIPSKASSGRTTEKIK